MNRIWKPASGPISLLLWLALWEFSLKLAGADERFFPPPTRIFAELPALLAGDNPEILLSLVDSGRRFLLALVLAVPSAFLLAAAIAFSRAGEILFSPLLAALYPVPRAAIYPLLLATFGIGARSQVLLIFLGIFLLLTLELQNAFRKIYTDRRYEVSRIFSVPLGKRVGFFLLRPVLPDFFVALKLSAGYGLVMVVVAETTAATSGIGAYIYRCWDRFDMPALYGALLTLGLIGWVLNAGCELARKAVQWPH